MYVIPAIDLRQGKCVRLIQGEYHRQITYDNDPVKQAMQFISAGAKWLHIVDLDGAKLGKPVNTETISAISASRKTQNRGWRRNQRRSFDKSNCLDMDVERVIIGTKAVSDFEWFSEMARKFTGKIALGLDARGSKVATDAWTKESRRRASRICC